MIENIEEKKKFNVLFLAALTAVVVLLGLTLTLLLISGKKEERVSFLQKDFSAIVKSASRNDVEAQFQLGKDFYYGESVSRDIDQALFWLTKAANAGYPPAAELLRKILSEQNISIRDGHYLWNQQNQ